MGQIIKKAFSAIGTTCLVILIFLAGCKTSAPIPGNAKVVVFHELKEWAPAFEDALVALKFDYNQRGIYEGDVSYTDWEFATYKDVAKGGRYEECRLNRYLVENCHVHTELRSYLSVLLFGHEERWTPGGEWKY